MSLRTHTLWSTAAALLGLVAALYVAATRAIVGAVGPLEAQAVATETSRANAVLQSSIRRLGAAAKTLARSEDVHRALSTGRAHAILPPRTASEDAIALLDAHRNVVFAAGYDAAGRPTQPPPDLTRQRSALSRRGSGILGVRESLLIVASAPVPSRKAGQDGLLILGQWLDFDAIERMRQATGYDISLQRLSSAALPQEYAAAQAGLRSEKPVHTANLDDNTIAGYCYLRDVNDRPTAILRVTMARRLFGKAQDSLHAILAALLLGAAAYLAVSQLITHRLIGRHLQGLAADVSAIESSGNLDACVRMEGPNDLVRLGAGINALLDATSRAQAKRRESEELYRQMAQMALTASDTLFVAVPDTGQMTWMGHVDEMLGYQPGAFPRDIFGWTMHIHPDDREAVQNAFSQATDHGESFDVEFRIRRIGGAHDYWEARGKPLRGQDGRIERIIGACTVINERKRAEEHLRASEERLARIVETNTDGILILDREGRITFANSAAVALFGYTRDELERHSFADPSWDVVSHDGRSLRPDQMPFARVFATGRTVENVELALRNAQGRRIMLSVNAAPLHDANHQVAGAVTTVSDITERKTMEERLTFQAFHDPLTGLANRALFLERLSRGLSRFERNAKPLAVLFLDLDNFKLINDSLGHTMGDHLLVAVARRLESCLRGHDTAARFGGDEFTVLAEDLGSPEEAVALAKRLLGEMRKSFVLGAREVYITPSIGVAVSGLGDASAEDLIRNADAAMYEAKTHGKARVEVFHPRLNTHALSRLEMVDDLRRALERGELEVYYQPKVCINTGKIEGVEALCRWRHPTQGFIPPCEFIPIAEENSLIVTLGRWVLTQACRQTQEWRLLSPEAKDLTVAVNISPRQFQDADLIGDVARILKETGLPPHALTLEITESVIMEEDEATIATLTALKNLGLRLAIDDFGTGYSSLAYLKRFPMDFVKIDRSFIDGLGTDNEDSVIVSATTSLAHALGLAVVAEGAETSNQIEQLRAIGCDLAQGYWYSHALNARELEHFLRQQAEPVTLPA